MSIHAALHHVTHYQYDRPVQLGPQIVRLRPAPHSRSKVVSYSLQVEPADHFVNWQQDPFANYMARLVFPEKTREFKVTVDLVVDMTVYNPFDFFLEPQAENFPFKYTPSQAQELAPYLACEPLTPKLKDYIAGIDLTEKRTIDFLVQINQRVQKDVNYLIRMEPGVQTPEETLTNASGSCRDSGWLLVQLLRNVGLAARFVSGYLIQLTPDVKALEGPSGTMVDFTDLHAWCEVFLPGAGWVGLDATSGMMAGEGHIPLACTPSPGSAAPIEGGVGPAEVTFAHEMTISRFMETPRVTLPYTEEQWAKVLELGDAVDERLVAGDVRLTMGGEPTFVATTDRDADEWNLDALGPTKRGYSTALVHRLQAEYGVGGFLHFGQGKWYPGEPLPRWALSIFWRADGEPLWADPSLFCDERHPTHYTADDARRFTETLAGKLGVGDSHIMAGYEDVYYYLWREKRLPVNVDPFASRLDDELERARLHRVFSQKLDAVIGYLLPLAPGNADADLPASEGPGWKSGSWFLREDRLHLIPGDSPMGFRLPLDSQPFASTADYPYQIDRDPTAPVADLLPATALSERYPAGAIEDTGADTTSTASDDATVAPERGSSAGDVMRTGLCVEVRDPRRANGPVSDKVGKASAVLYVFMPPLERLEDYLDLVVAIEATARDLKMQIVMEGYPPPRDPRLKALSVTPDPGVIEVNVHPVNSWRELVANTDFLYDAAWQTGLSAEKFMTDGRHTGTGGGNHIVMGGATTEDSPFLRRPELLASLLLYWHNHPSLSYLFSGMFIGPSSQAPRVDEARNDQLYEMEIAIKQIHEARKKHGEAMPPWVVDRTLRNILIDISGNTHRSEFCIDKLYSPDSSTGRLGLLELRAFEMPPHARMSIVQQLLIRALVARFWEEPYEAPAARWGTELHDRFLLPTFVKMDFDDVIAEMNRAGFAFDANWFAPHLEFRFPLMGDMKAMGIELQLRNALEPWHVMGEETRSGATARYVDSSLERIEVRVTGLNESRHVVTVNGRALPLQPTGVKGEFVAGVRYKAWNPPSSLHPAIEAHAPLTFDLVDTWMKRSMGGCQYFVSHPGGLSYDSFPVNANEAESRRHSRFLEMGHTPGTMDVPPATIELCGSREFPFTLDLRR